MTATIDQPTTPLLSRAEIERRAEEVIRTCGGGRLPINPLALARALDIRVFGADFDDPDTIGTLTKTGAEVTALLNQDGDPFRKRYTLAHQIGHFLLHVHGEDGEFADAELNLFRRPVPDRAGPVAEDIRREIEANTFATALLMPEDRVREEWPRYQSIEEMARRFNVSAEAMGQRLDQLGLE